MTFEAVPVLRVADARAAVQWLHRLGYAQEWEHQFKPDFPLFVSVAAAGSGRIFLSEHKGDAPGPALVYLRVPDLDAAAAEFGAPVVAQPWGREVHLTDPDGNAFRLGELAEPTEPAT